MFVEVQLYTADEHFVVSGRIPRFNKWPDVIGWGDRLFRFGREADGEGIYFEAFAFWLLVDADGNPIPPDGRVGDLVRLSGCTCAEIMTADETRHFRECPLRERFPVPRTGPEAATPGEPPMAKAVDIVDENRNPFGPTKTVVPKIPTHRHASSPPSPQKPSVGRIVHFRPLRSQAGSEALVRDYPAIIVSVHENEQCDLFVFIPVGSLNLEEIPHAPNEEPRTGHWHFPRRV